MTSAVLASILFTLFVSQNSNSVALAVLDAYVNASGGEQAARAIHSRTVEGTFDNGRGLRTRFRIVEKEPTKRTKCVRLDVVSTNDREHVLSCGTADGRSEHLYFDAKSGLLTSQESSRTGGGMMTVRYDDYRLVDGVRVAFITEIVLPDARIRYVADRVQNNGPVDDSVFRKPPR